DFDVVLRPITAPDASHGVAGGHPPVPPSPFAVHVPATSPFFSCTSFILICERKKRWALDVHTPLKSTLASISVGSGAQAPPRTIISPARRIFARRRVSGTIIDGGYITTLPILITKHCC